jgi:hypothetical protein
VPVAVLVIVVSADTAAAGVVSAGVVSAPPAKGAEVSELEPPLPPSIAPPPTKIPPLPLSAPPLPATAPPLPSPAPVLLSPLAGSCLIYEIVPIIYYFTT